MRGLLASLLLPAALGQTQFMASSPAPPASVVRWGDARFSFLTPTLVRLELASRAGVFDDRQTIAAVNRGGFVPPALTVTTAGDVVKSSNSASSCWRAHTLSLTHLLFQTPGSAVDKSLTGVCKISYRTCVSHNLAPTLHCTHTCKHSNMSVCAIEREKVSQQ